MKNSKYVVIVRVDRSWNDFTSPVIVEEALVFTHSELVKYLNREGTSHIVSVNKIGESVKIDDLVN